MLVALHVPMAGIGTNWRRHTTAVVAAALVMLVVLALGGAGPANGLAWALLVGVCGSAATVGGRGAMTRTGQTANPQPTAAVPVTVELTLLFGLVLLAVLSAAEPSAVGWALTETAAIPLVAAAAAACLVLTTDVEAEGQVFVAGMVLLLAGTCDALRMSSLACGFLAGTAFRWLPVTARDAIMRHLALAGRPAVVWVLVSVGARFEFVPVALAAVAAFALLQIATNTMRAEDPITRPAAGFIGIALAVDSLSLSGETSLATLAFAMVVSAGLVADAGAVAMRWKRLR